MAQDSFLDRPVQSLHQWLGDGARCDGFEEWVREATEWAGIAPPAKASLIRMITTLSVAVLESCRTETTLHGQSVETVMARLPSAAGVAVMAAVLCVARDDATALDKLAEVMTRGFGSSCRDMAAQNRQASQ